VHSGLSSRGFAVSYPNVLGGPLHAFGRSRSIGIPIGWASRSTLHVRRPPGATVDSLAGRDGGHGAQRGAFPPAGALDPLMVALYNAPKHAAAQRTFGLHLLLLQIVCGHWLVPCDADSGNMHGLEPVKTRSDGDDPNPYPAAPLHCA
jgi:hypothetical protein